MALTARLCESVRAGGTYISGTNGTSNGIVPMLRVYNQTARFVNQGGGKRMGSFAVYIEPWHADIFEFLDLRKNHGKEEVSFQWTNPDFLFKNPDLLIRNPDLLLKTVDFIMKCRTRRRKSTDTASSATSHSRRSPPTRVRTHAMPPRQHDYD